MHNLTICSCVCVSLLGLAWFWPRRKRERMHDSYTPSKPFERLYEWICRSSFFLKGVGIECITWLFDLDFSLFHLLFFFMTNDVSMWTEMAKKLGSFPNADISKHAIKGRIGLLLMICSMGLRASWYRLFHTFNLTQSILFSKYVSKLCGQCAMQPT